MTSGPLSNDTALCLAASALQGKPALSQSQRELLKAVAHAERVGDIVRHARLPERLAKRELLVLLERGLLALKDPDSARYRERQSSGIEHDSSEDRHVEREALEDRHSVTRWTGDETGAPEVNEPAIESPRRAGAAVARWVQPPPPAVSRPARAASQPTPDAAREETGISAEMDAAFERLHSMPKNNLEGGDGNGGGPTPRHTRVPSTLPSGTPGSVELPGEFRIPPLPQGFAVPRPGTAGSGQPRSTLRSPAISGTNTIPPLNEEAHDPSRPAPRFSGIEALKPGAFEQAQPLDLAVGGDGFGGLAIPRLPSTAVDGTDDRLGGEPIPLVTVVRSPMITLGRPQSSPNLNPMQPLNAAHDTRPGVGSNTRPGVGNPREPGGASVTGHSTGGFHPGQGRHDPASGAGPTTPPSSEPRSGSTIEGMPAQSPAPPPPPAQPARLGSENPLGRTAIGGISAPPDPNRRPSVVVRPAGRDSMHDVPSSPFDATPTGQTLLGVLAPTAEQLRQVPANDSLHSSMEAKASSTSTTMPSLRAGEIQSQLGTADEAPRSEQHLDHYEVIECLARGGSGVVYKVRDPRAAAGHFLALKVLRQGTHRIAENVESFVHEALLMEAMAHPNLVELHYFGRENDEPFLLMEYVEGLSMSDLLHHPVPLPLDVGLIIVQDALQALDYVHNVQLPEIAPHGLVHCDVSPQNLLIGVDGYTRLIDFGTSRSAGLIVGDAAVRCKPRYSSPELIAGEAVSAESDIFSMGAVLFQLLSKQPAFSADPTRRKRESLVPNPSMLNRRAPTPFDPICQRALDPDPSRRFSSAREMLETLDAAVEISGIELRRQRICFWVRRVLQSRHGDVEFDMTELEDLLDNKRSYSSRPPAVAPSNRPPSSNPEHTKNVELRQGRSVPPPAVGSRTPTREFAAPQDDRYTDSSPPSSDGQIGAASRFEQLPEGESPLQLKTRLWVTGAAIGAIIAIAAYALLSPTRQQAPAANTPWLENQPPPNLPSTDFSIRREISPPPVNDALPSEGALREAVPSEEALPPATPEPQLQAPPVTPEPLRPLVAPVVSPVNEPEPPAAARAPVRQAAPRAAAPRPEPPRIAPAPAPAPAPPPAFTDEAPLPEPDRSHEPVPPQAAAPKAPEASEAPAPPAAAPPEPSPPAAAQPSDTPPPSSAAPPPRVSPAAPLTPRTEALPDRGRPTAPRQP